MGKRKKVKSKNSSPAEEKTPSSYWHRRYSLFSKYDQGIRLNEQQWYSVTPESIARITSVQIKLRFPNCRTIFDPFGGAGGNTIQFALHFPKVYYNELDIETYSHSIHNASIYGVKDNIEFLNQDFYSTSRRDISDMIDVVFLSIPWGGPSYLNNEYWDLEEHGLFDAVAKSRQFSSNICMFIPKTSKLEQIAELVSNEKFADVDYMFVKGACKGICVYLGSDLVHNNYKV